MSSIGWAIPHTYRTSKRHFPRPHAAAGGHGRRTRVILQNNSGEELDVEPTSI
jgi:hypothetical protein